MKRDRSIDVLKGIGILLMVFDHAINVCGGYDQLWYIHRYIQSFHMPLFFIASGYLYKTRSFKDQLMRKSKGLLIPYFSFAFFYLCIIIAKFIIKGSGFNQIISFLEGILLFPTDQSLTQFASPIWFLIALFNVEIVFNLVDNSCKKSTKASVILALGAIGLIYASNTALPMLPFAIEPALTGIIFFEFGYIARHYIIRPSIIDSLKNQRGGQSIVYVLMLLSSQIVLSMLNRTIDMRTARYYNGALYLTNGIVGTIVTYYISCLITKFKFSSYIIYCSVHSVVYLGMNYFVLFAIEKLLSKIFCIHDVMILLVFVLGMILLTFLVIPMEKILERIRIAI